MFYFPCQLLVLEMIYSVYTEKLEFRQIQVNMKQEIEKISYSDPEQRKAFEKDFLLTWHHVYRVSLRLT